MHLQRSNHSNVYTLCQSPSPRSSQVTGQYLKRFTKSTQPIEWRHLNWLTFVEFDPVTPTDWCWPTTLCTLHNDTDIDAMRIKEVAEDVGGGDDADAGQVWQREPAVQRQLLFYFVFSLTPWKQLITKLRQRQRRLQSIKDVLAKTSRRIMDERSKKEKKDTVKAGAEENEEEAATNVKQKIAQSH